MNNRISFVDNINRGLRGFFILLVVFSFLSQGAVREVPLHLICAGFYICLAIATLAWDWREPLPRLVVIAIVLTVILALWGAIQAATFAGNPFENPIWQMAGEINGPTIGTISIAPGDTIETILPITLPFVAFAAGYLLFSRDESATALLSILLTIATVGALVAILQFQFYPDRLLFAEKIYYLDSLTVFFVNRNTGATYLAVHLVLAAGFCLKYWQAVSEGNIGKILLSPDEGRRQSEVLKFALSAFSFLVLLTALMLTRSRGGVGSGMAGLAVFALLAAFYGSRRRRTGSGPAKRPRMALRIGSALVVIVLLIGVFGGRVVLRAEAQGTEDQRFCMYPAIVRLVADNWLLGTGYGTFRDAFSAYRPAECGVQGDFNKAHSVYLGGLAAMGVAFVPLLAIVVFGQFAVLWQGLRTRRAYRWAPMSGLAILVIVLLHSAIDFSVEIPGFALAFAALTAVTNRISLN